MIFEKWVYSQQYQRLTIQNHKFENLLLFLGYQRGKILWKWKISENCDDGWAYWKVQCPACIRRTNNWTATDYLYGTIRYKSCSVETNDIISCNDIIAEPTSVIFVSTEGPVPTERSSQPYSNRFSSTNVSVTWSNDVTMMMSSLLRYCYVKSSSRIPLSVLNLTSWLSVYNCIPKFRNWLCLLLLFILIYSIGWSFSFLKLQF